MMTDEQVGELLRGQARCEEHNQRLSGEIEKLRDEGRADRERLRVSITAALGHMDQKHAELEERQTADEKREERRAGMVLALRVVGAVLIAALGTGSGYLWNDLQEQADTVDRHDRKLGVLEPEVDRLGLAERALRERVRSNEGELRELTPTIGALRDVVGDLADEVRELRRRQR